MNDESSRHDSQDDRDTNQEPKDALRAGVVKVVDNNFVGHGGRKGGVLWCRSNDDRRMS